MAAICESDLVRAGVDIGGTDTKIGLVKLHRYPRLCSALRNKLAYSACNLKYGAKIAATCSGRELVQTVSALVSWSRNIAILEKVKGAEECVWYINKMSEYRVTSSLPAELEAQLPSVEDIQNRIR